MEINNIMEKKYYSDERAVQIIISLLKANGIKKIVASPGTTNLTFVGSVQQDPWFEIYSSVDERSAAYIACGLSAESGEPVVLTCTGATASRNYYSGLTEAYYRKLPILAITSHQGNDRIGHLIAQNLDRRNIPNDIVRLSVEVPYVTNEREEFQATIEANRAILELKRNGGGPVHINLFTRYSRNFTVRELPSVRTIRRYCRCDDLPSLEHKKVAIFVGAHTKFTEAFNVAIENFCSTFDAVVFCDHTSGYYGKYRAQMCLPFSQTQFVSSNRYVDICIHIGEVSGSEGLEPIAKEVWRVSEDGEIRDTYKKLTNVFQMPEVEFFKYYAPNASERHSYIDLCNADYQKVYNAIPELPFSNIWVAKTLSQKLPASSVLHLGILNSLRSWNFFKLPEGVETNCNVGGFGIDGDISSLLGASFVHPEKLYFLAIGDLAFFYDMNTLGNRHMGNNVRILLVNNGCGSEFKLYSHPCYAFGDDANKYMAAAGHFGNKSSKLVRHYAEDLGFEYLTASSKEEFENNVERFVNAEMKRPIVFEVFTVDKDESDALYAIKTSYEDKSRVAKQKMAKALRAVGGDKIVDAVKSIMK